MGGPFCEMARLWYRVSLLMFWFAAARAFVSPGQCSTIWVYRRNQRLKRLWLNSSWWYYGIGHLTMYYMSLWKCCSKVFQQMPKHSCTDGLEKHEGPGPCGQHCHGGIVLVGTWSVKRCCESVVFYKLRVTKTAELGSKASWAWLPKAMPITYHRQTWGNGVSNLQWDHCFQTVTP